MDNSKKYYILCDKKRTLIRFDNIPGVLVNLEEFDCGWGPASYDIKKVVEKAVKFEVLDRDGVATEITTDEELDRVVVRKIAESLGRGADEIERGM